MGHETFGDGEFGIFSHVGRSDAYGGIDPLDLNTFHVHGAAFFQLKDGFGIHDAGAVAVAASIVAFHILHFGIFSKEKTVNSVVLTVRGSAVVDAASGYYGDIGIFADEKIVVNHFF